MRSRFSAYAHKDYQYIYHTYAASSQQGLTVADLQQSGDDSLWLALKVYACQVPLVTATCADDTNIGTIDDEQFVEFSAFYIADNVLYEMREKSRFVLEKTAEGKQALQWRYVDGDIIKHQALSDITRGQLCPCNEFDTAWSVKQGKRKKYKQCCGQPS